MTDFPLAKMEAREDAQKFGIEYEDNAIKIKTEGGYRITRPRHTRAPRATITTGFTNISNDDKEVLEEFFAKVGTYDHFNYTDPTSDVVRVMKMVGPLPFVFAGIGGGNLHRWNVTFKLVQE